MNVKYTDKERWISLGVLGALIGGAWLLSRLPEPMLIRVPDPPEPPNPRLAHDYDPKQDANAVTIDAQFARLAP